MVPAKLGEGIRGVSTGLRPRTNPVEHSHQQSASSFNGKGRRSANCLRGRLGNYCWRKNNSFLGKLGPECHGNDFQVVRKDETKNCKGENNMSHGKRNIQIRDAEGDLLEVKGTAKYLGVWIDSRLKFHTHTA